MRFAAVALFLLFPSVAAARPGELDGRFGLRGQAIVSLTEASTQARAIAVQPDGRVLVTGTARRVWIVARLRASGRLDSSFGVRGVATVPIGPYGSEPQALALMPDGAVVVGGTPFSDGNTKLAYVARLRPDGKLDPAWGTGGIATIEAWNRIFFGGMAIQPDGGVAVAMSVHDEADQHFVVMRLRADGQRDWGFAGGGAHVEPAPGAANGIIARPDGGLIVAGESGRYSGPYFGYGRTGGSELLVALTANGRVDHEWGVSGRFIGPRNSKALAIVTGHDGGAVVLDSLSAQTGVLWLEFNGEPREEWGLAGRAAVPGTPAALGVGRHAVDGAGRVYVPLTDPSFTSAPGPAASVARIDRLGRTDIAFGRNGVTTVPTTRKTVRAVAEAVAGGPGERVFLAASGANRLAGDREDIGYTHALVARLKGWSPIMTPLNVLTRARSRRTTVWLTCTAPEGRRCTFRADILDRRGHRLARRRGHAANPSVAKLTLTLARPARAGERLTFRYHGTDDQGRADDVTQRVTVPRR
jgi:uncharacterized delta-60 repeat protein